MLSRSGRRPRALTNYEGDGEARLMVTAVVVTGASRGFGRATATALAKELVEKQQRVDMVRVTRSFSRHAHATCL
jgi:NAD(P)-dependent dehydrogenase (short-subunit alcohol dehydrogenase family)